LNLSLEDLRRAILHEEAECAECGGKSTGINIKLTGYFSCQRFRNIPRALTAYIISA
jgi:hypothetical protein